MSKKYFLIITFIINLSFYHNLYSSDQDYCVGYLEEVYWSLDPIEEIEVRERIIKFFDDNFEGAEAPESESESNEHGPKYNAIINALQALKPSSLTLIDNSHQHAGHAGNDMDGESHFELQIVAEAFEGLNLVKRHQLIYMILGEIMPQIHALQIQSLTPEEAENK